MSSIRERLWAALDVERQAGAGSRYAELNDAAAAAESKFMLALSEGQPEEALHEMVSEWQAATERFMSATEGSNRWH